MSHPSISSMVTPEGEGWRRNWYCELSTQSCDRMMYRICRPYYSNFESECLLFKECPTSLSRTQVLCTVSHVPGSRLFSLPCRTRTGSSAQIVVDPWKESAFFLSPISLCGENFPAIWWSGYSLTARVPLHCQSLLLLGRQWGVFLLLNDNLIYFLFVSCRDCYFQRIRFWTILINL